MRTYKSIIQKDTTRCAICDQRKHLDWHHVRCGNKSREKSEEWGLMLALCRNCHMNLHSSGPLKLKWQKIAQEKFIALYGEEKWMKEFGKDYL